MRRWQGNVGIRTERESFALACAEGEVRVVGESDAGAPLDWALTLPEMGLVRAVMGTDGLADRVGERADAVLADVLNVLFPPKHPHFWLADAL